MPVIAILPKNLLMKVPFQSVDQLRLVENEVYFKLSIVFELLNLKLN